MTEKGFPDSSVGKESACNAGDPGSSPELGRSSGEVIGYPLQHSWTYLMAQLVKNLPAMQKTWVQSLGQEDPLEKGNTIHWERIPSILTWRIPWTVQSMQSQRDMTERLSLQLVTEKQPCFQNGEISQHNGKIIWGVQQ